MEPDEYYLLIEGETYGPYTMEQVQKLWHEAQVPLDTLFVHKGMKEVRPLEEVINQVIAYQKPPPPPPAPPPPDSPMVAKTKRVVRWSLLALSLGVLIYSIRIDFFPEEVPPEPVRAGVTVSAVKVKVVNNNHYVWTNRLVRLNDNDSGAFQYRIRRLEPGKTLSIPLVFFRGRGGKPFEPWRAPVTGVWVSDHASTFQQTIVWRE